MIHLPPNTVIQKVTIIMNFCSTSADDFVSGVSLGLCLMVGLAPGSKICEIPGEVIHGEN